MKSILRSKLFTPEEALSHWNLSAPISTSDDQGLINQTWLVGSQPKYVLQWVNPIFDEKIHEDISAVIKHIRTKGTILPQLIQLPDGRNCLPDKEGTWRMLQFVPGRTLHSITNTQIAIAAGTLVGQFHEQLLDFDHEWIAPRRDIHNTPERMNDLQNALEKADGHPLEVPSRKLGGAILNAWKNWDGTLEQPLRVCHGDLKISNLRFDQITNRGVCLIDLDTLGPQMLSVEMGDAWRSWCNPSGESNPDEVYFDTDYFSQSAQSWLQQIPHLLDIEKQSLVAGIERICLELSARFCADAINNNYFKEDRVAHPIAGQHNLIKATSQYALAKQVNTNRIICEQKIKEIL
jgi:hypothetical protein